MFEALDKYIPYFALVLTAIAIAAIVTPFVIKFALAWGVYDKPKSLEGIDKKVLDTNLHNRIMPRMGFFAVILPIFIITPFFVPITIKEIIIASTLVILTILGILDDKYRLSALPQLLVQIFCIVIVILCGVTIHDVNNPFTNSFLNFDRANITFAIGNFTIAISLLSAVITFIWMIFVTNAIAWSDGVDGVLNGTMAISALIIMLVSIRENVYSISIVSALFLGGNLGFLPYNFAPAKIINGFGGSIYGYMIAILSILGQVKLSIALIAIIIPVMDVMWVIVYRIKKYKPKTLRQLAKAVNTPGKVHFHHRLLELGLSTKKVAFVEYLLAAFVSMIAFLLSGLELTFAIFSSAVLVLLIFIILDRIIKRKILIKDNNV